VICYVRFLDSRIASNISLINAFPISYGNISGETISLVRFVENDSKKCTCICQNFYDSNVQLNHRIVNYYIDGHNAGHETTRPQTFDGKAPAANFGLLNAVVVRCIAIFIFQITCLGEKKP